MDDKFNFLIEAKLCALEKSQKTSDLEFPSEVRLGGIGSTESKDAQGETLLDKILDISYILSGQGFFNWDHGKDPSDFIGAIDPSKVTRRPFYVEGPLFMDMPKAQACYRLIKAMEPHGRRIGLSVDGGLLRDKHGNIIYAKVVNVSVAPNPVNTGSLAALVKSWSTQVAPVEVLQKTMEAGHATAAEMKVDGGALRMESLEGQVIPIEEAVKRLIARCPYLSESTALALLKKFSHKRSVQ